MTREEALNALEAVVEKTPFPDGRFYRIERKEDAYRGIHYNVYISSLGTPVWETYGHGSTMEEAILAALLKVPN